MMNKKLIVEMLKRSDSIIKKRSYMYMHANANEKIELLEPYRAALADFDVRVQMVLAFGYTVQRNSNDEVIGIKKAKD